MKKSLLALAAVASVASSIVLSPVVSAQDVYSETDQYRPVAEIKDGDISEKCDAIYKAGAIIDPRLQDPANTGYTYKVKSPHAADGGFSNPDSAGTLAVQHWFTQSASAPNAPGTVNFRTIIGADAPIADAKVVFTLPELPEGGQWRVDPVVLNNPALRADGVTPMQTWNYVRDYQNLPVTLEGKYDAEANTITYELGDMPANSGVTAKFSATGLTYSQIMEFTQPVDGFYSNNFEVSAELTGEFEKGYAVTCAPEGAYDDSFTTPGEEVTVNLNNEDTFAPGTKFSVKNSSEGWTVSVDENGRIVATPPADTANGVYDILIEAVSPIGAVYQIPARVHVSSPVNLEFDPSYDDSFTTPGQSVIVNLNGEAGVPAGSTFEVTDFPAGWTVNVTDQGRVTATPPADSKSVVETVTVTITTPSGEKVEVPARIHVQAEPTIEMEVGYRDADGNLHVGELPPGVDGIAGHVVTITESNGETSQYFVPNGVDGKTAAVEVTPGERDGVEGSIVVSFYDIDGDGVYTEGVDEFLTETFIPNGRDGRDTKAVVEKAEGGSWVITYFDENGDGEFTADEEVSREFIADGGTPVIGENGNWFIGGEDTGIPARGTNGADGQTPIIGENGNWFIGGEDTGVKATCDCGAGADGKAITVTEQGLTDEGDVWVLFSDGTRIVIPSGRDADNLAQEQGVLDPGANAGSSANERCLPAALTVAAPLLMLLPLGIISQVDLPIARELNSQMAAASAEVQKSLGIFNAQGAQSAARLNGELAKYGEIGGMVGGALIGIAVIGLLTKYMVDNCAPVAEGEEPGSFALPEGFGSSN